LVSIVTGVERRGEEAQGFLLPVHRRERVAELGMRRKIWPDRHRRLLSRSVPALPAGRIRGRRCCSG
jgi:hypothetical protein